MNMRIIQSDFSFTFRKHHVVHVELFIDNLHNFFENFSFFKTLYTKQIETKQIKILV